MRAFLRRIVPPAARRVAARFVRKLRVEESDYSARIARELETYEDCENVHDLPAIFHYWSHKYLLPKVQYFGFGHPDEFFANNLYLAASASPSLVAKFASVGSGNCDTEVRVAKLLREKGLGEFVIECLDINPAMLQRGREYANAEAVTEHVKFTLADFNRWQPDGSYRAVMANQSLHHVSRLEHLFDAVAKAIGPKGRFVMSDMIGRNGHQRWPEARKIVDEYWRELPERYRYNQQLKRLELEYMDWDCAVDGFEGIRAQDILPLLRQRFGFEMFLPFANVIDPFVDRAFGHNFDAAASWDQAFIDRVHERDEREIEAGAIKPTHMFAVVSNNMAAETRQWKHLSPSFSTRVPN